MNRYAVFLLLISSHPQNTFSVISQTAKEGEKLKKQIESKENATIIDKHRIMSKCRAVLFSIINTKDLSTQQKNHALALESKCANEIENRLDKEFYDTYDEAFRDMQLHRTMCLANIAKIMTAYHYEIYIAQKGLEYNEASQKKFEQEAYNKAFDRAQEGVYYGNVEYLVTGVLEKQLEEKIDALTAKIYEIYPHEKSPSYQTTINAFSQGKYCKNTKCCACKNSFEKIRKRVNLPCGHNICPACLEKNMYEYKRTECPQCKHPITQIDFPANYFEYKKNKSIKKPPLP